MNEPERERLSSLLRDALPPVGEQEPRADLWPLMLKRLERQPAPASWLDFALGALAAAAMIAFPQVIPWVLIQC